MVDIDPMFILRTSTFQTLLKDPTIFSLLKKFTKTKSKLDLNSLTTQICLQAIPLTDSKPYLEVCSQKKEAALIADIMNLNSMDKVLNVAIQNYRVKREKNFMAELILPNSKGQYTSLLKVASKLEDKYNFMLNYIDPKDLDRQDLCNRVLAWAGEAGFLRKGSWSASNLLSEPVQNYINGKCSDTVRVYTDPHKDLTLELISKFNIYFTFKQKKSTYTLSERIKFIESRDNMLEVLSEAKAKGDPKQFVPLWVKAAHDSYFAFKGSEAFKEANRPIAMGYLVGTYKEGVNTAASRFLNMVRDHRPDTPPQQEERKQIKEDW